MFQVMSAREKKLQIDDCNKLTEHLLVALPKLLDKVFIYLYMSVVSSLILK